MIRSESLLRALTVAVAAIALGAAAPARDATTEEPHEIRFRVADAAIMDWLQAATPVTITVGSGLMSVDLILSDPRDLMLRAGRADLTIRVSGRTLPVDERFSATVTIVYDQNLRKYFVVFRRLPLRIPGLGAVDLSEHIPRFEIPSLVEDLWRFADRPVGLNLDIRRLAIVDRAVEVAGDISFVPVAGPRPARR